MTDNEMMTKTNKRSFCLTNDEKKYRYCDDALNFGYLLKCGNDPCIFFRSIFSFPSVDTFRTIKEESTKLIHENIFEDG